MPKALITGITGQDGSYLAEFLLEKDYRVYGLVRRSSSPNLDRLEHLLERLRLVSGDMLDPTSLDEAMRTIRPDEVYNLAAQSFVHLSWKQPIFTTQATALGVTHILEAIRKHKPDARFYQASSSEMYGNTPHSPQNEMTPFHPRSPYGISKLYGHWITINYRESYGMFACSGICFNHESPRRGREFVTRKIAWEAARIARGLSRKLELGNLQARRDWGFAGDYVAAMWKMLQQSRPGDYVVATGETHSVREFAELAFRIAGLNWKRYVKEDPGLIRPAEIHLLVGDASKARKKLRWKPSVSFPQLVEKMVRADLQRLA